MVSLPFIVEVLIMTTSFSVHADRRNKTFCLVALLLPMGLFLLPWRIMKVLMLVHIERLLTTAYY